MSPCETCRFWLRSGERGTCRRYPEWIATAAGHSCGEWKAHDKRRKAKEGGK